MFCNADKHHFGYDVKKIPSILNRHFHLSNKKDLVLKDIFIKNLDSFMDKNITCLFILAH